MQNFSGWQSQIKSIKHIVATLKQTRDGNCSKFSSFFFELNIIWWWQVCYHMLLCLQVLTPIFYLNRHWFQLLNNLFSITYTNSSSLTPIVIGQEGWHLLSYDRVYILHLRSTHVLHKTCVSYKNAHNLVGRSTYAIIFVHLQSSQIYLETEFSFHYDL